MASALPTDDANTKALDVYGLGTYEGPRDGELNGEDDEETTAPSLPGTPDPVYYEPYIGYPQSYDSQGRHASFAEILSRNPILSGPILGKRTIAISGLPNDPNINPLGVINPNSNTKGGVLSPTDVTNTTSNSQLPDDEDPPARTDYYDSMQSGSNPIQFDAIKDIWPSQDTGAYVSSESLPTPPNNDQKSDIYTNGIGNYMSGFVLEDQAVPEGFPSEDYLENSSYPQSNTDTIPGGGIVAMQGRVMRHIATDIPFVENLTKQFLKDHGKKNITRRAVTSFLQDNGHGDKQYIASDIVRCLKHSHNIIVPDALDIFPVKTASMKNGLNEIHRELVAMEIRYSDNKLVSNEIGKCAVKIASIMSILKG